MPTSEQEAKKIVQIVNDYLLPDEACELSQRLDEEVGVITTNESLKVSLKMLRVLLECQLEQPEYKLLSDSSKYKITLVSFYCLVALHIFVVVFNILAFLLLPILADWYLIIPMMSLLVMLNFSRNIDCPLTRLENYLRVRLGKKRIGGFIGHYFVKPLRRHRRRLILSRETQE
jgi:hypothetical protein